MRTSSQDYAAGQGGLRVKMNLESGILRPERSRDMEQPRPKLPTEAIELYNLYIHGEIERRDFLSGISKVAVAGLTAGAIIDMLMPNYALGQQVSKTDERIKASYVTIPSPQGNGSIKAYLVRPISADTREATAGETPGHSRRPRESRPQSAHRGHRAAHRARQLHGVRARCAHLGRRLPGRRCKGRGDVQQGRQRKKTEDFVAAAHVAEGASRLHRKDRRHRLLLRRRDFEYAGRAARSRSGGGRAVLRRPAAAADIPKIKAAILVHHGELDTRLAATWPAYDAALKAAGVPHEGYIYPGAVHGFNCDATPERYNKAAADLAWQRTIDWFNKYVRG